MLRANDACDVANNELGLRLVVLPAHLAVASHHAHHVVVEKDHDPWRHLTMKFAQFDHSHVEVAHSEWVTSALLIVKGVPVFG